MTKRVQKENVEATTEQAAAVEPMPESQGNAAGNALPPRQRGRRLRSPTQVKGALGFVFRGLEAGTIDPNRANAMTNVLRELANVMGADVAKEIDEIKAELKAQATGARTAQPWTANA